MARGHPALPTSPWHIAGKDAQAPGVQRGKSPLCVQRLCPSREFARGKDRAEGENFGTGEWCQPKCPSSVLASCLLAHLVAALCRGSHSLPVQSLSGTAHPQPQSTRLLGGDGKDLLWARKSLLSPPAGPQWAATMHASPAPLPSPSVTRGPARPGSRRGDGRRASVGG